MFTVTIRDHIMIAHSLPAPVFGPARQMHGATYVVDAEFAAQQLDAFNIVIDIGLAHQILSRVLDALRYQNLDAVPEFQGKLTTTEFLAAWIHGQIAAEVRDTFSGSLKVTLGESHVASASYAAPVA